MGEDINQPASGAGFPPTHWSLVLAAGTGEGPLGEAALAGLCRTYWKPLYAYLRRQGKPPHDAEDLVQGFLQKMISREDFRRAHPARGPFRRYLLSCLKHWVMNQDLAHRAAKRGGGKVISFEPGEAEALCGADPNAASPEQAYDRGYANTVLAEALRRLEEEHQTRGKESLFEALAPFLDGADATGYQVVAARLGMSSNTLAQSVRRLRLRLREFVRDEVRRTVTSEEEFEAEMQDLTRVWSS